MEERDAVIVGARCAGSTLAIALAQRGWDVLVDPRHAHAIPVAESLSGPDPTLDGYEEWRDARAAEHYDWSFDWGRFPRPPLSEKLFRGWANDPDAGQDVRDTLTRRVEPSRAMSKDRMERWLAEAPLEAGA